MHPKLLDSTIAQCRAYLEAGDCHREAPPTERLIAAVVEMDEQIKQLARALRAEVEPPIFMGEPIVIAAANPALDQGPCTVCGKPRREHGTYPVYESHNYTPAGVKPSGGGQR